MKKKYLSMLVDIQYLDDEDILTVSDGDGEETDPFFKEESDSEGWT